MKLRTVTGLVEEEYVRLADGHGHVWIKPPKGVSRDARLRLCDYTALEVELADFRLAGGNTIVDCQPGGCGRDAQMLVRLATATGLHITATTGFHRRRYYPPTHWLWSASEEEISAYFVDELSRGMHETNGTVPATTGPRGSPSADTSRRIVRALPSQRPLHHHLQLKLTLESSL